MEDKKYSEVFRKELFKRLAHVAAHNESVIAEVYKKVVAMEAVTDTEINVLLSEMKQQIIDNPKSMGEILGEHYEYFGDIIIRNNNHFGESLRFASVFTRGIGYHPDLARISVGLFESVAFSRTQLFKSVADKKHSRPEAAPISADEARAMWEKNKGVKSLSSVIDSSIRNACLFSEDGFEKSVTHRGIPTIDLNNALAHRYKELGFRVEISGAANDGTIRVSW